MIAHAPAFAWGPDFMRIPLYQIDAFTGHVFGGNPAAVCPLTAWPSDQLLQAIAEENNLAETAFFVPEGDSLRLRWFTPQVEVDLCGHATLAAGFAIMQLLEPGRREVLFQSRSGPLTVRRAGDELELDFPVVPSRRGEIPDLLVRGLGVAPVEMHYGMDLMAVLEDEGQVKALHPDFQLLSQLETRGIIVTAPGREVDFVSRFFAPRVGIAEDPVTGSAHCMLAPYWAERLGKREMRARQLSRRGGEISCRLEGERVLLGGRAVLYLSGEISDPNEI